MASLLRFWISFCAFLVALGWILSAFHALTVTPYVIAIGGFMILAPIPAIKNLIFRREVIFHRLKSFRLLLPGIFALSVLLLFLKGILMPPFHDDGLCYRIPRAMHWIMDHQWHWIGAEDPRLDVLGTVSEWLTVPILLFSHSDRLVFLPNWICHLFLPALIFSVWRMLGVSSRIAWLSMWLLPTGFCFALQAVNTSNDSLGAFFILSAFFFALKGNQSRNWNDFAFSLISMALATGVKLNLLSLGLGWAVAMKTGWRILPARPMRAGGVLLLGTLVSFVPTAYFNWLHVHVWTGLGYMQPPPPWVNFVCTSFYLFVQNLAPPLLIMPHPGPIVIPGMEGTFIGDLMQRYFLPPMLYSQLAVEQAGVGFIVVITFVLLFLTTRHAYSKSPVGLKSFFNWRFLIFTCIGVAFIHYMLFVNSDQPARLICPYYLVLLSFFFVGRSLRNHIPRYLYKIGVGIAMLTGLYFALFFTENPLLNYFPSFNERLYLDNRFIEEAQRDIPVDEKSVGIIRYYNQRETWLWKPYGSRKVIELPFRPDPQKTRELGIEYVVISREMLAMNNLTIDSWLAEQPWTLVGQVVFGRDNSWYFVKARR